MTRKKSHSFDKLFPLAKINEPHSNLPLPRFGLHIVETSQRINPSSRRGKHRFTPLLGNSTATTTFSNDAGRAATGQRHHRELPPTSGRRHSGAPPRSPCGGQDARLPRPPSCSRRSPAPTAACRRPAPVRHGRGSGGREAPAHCAPRGPSPPRPQSLPAPVPIRLRGQRPPLWRDRGE